MIHGPQRSVPGPLVTIMSDGYFCTEADSSSAKSCGIGMAWSLPGVFSGLAGEKLAAAAGLSVPRVYQIRDRRR